MVINRNNYEEYFLLYIDEELSASERQLVELFVQQNADLAGELELLLCTKLDGDSTIITDKSSLYRHSGSKIDEANYEEMFLLYIDDELTEANRKEVEIFLSQNPGKQQIFKALKQTKLIPEEIVFTNKELLYKRKKTAVLLISWLRVAVAAVFIGLLIGTWSLWTPTKVKNTITVNALPSKKINPYREKGVAPSLQHPDTATVAAIPKILIRKNREIENRSKQQVIPELAVQNDLVAGINKRTPTLDSTDKRDEIAMIKPENKTNNKQDPGISNAQQIQNISNNTATDSKRLIQKTVYKELDTEDATNNNIYIGNLQINKNTLTGLLKRASHIFNKTADDGNGIAVANFTINKSLR